MESLFYTHTHTHTHLFHSTSNLLAPPHHPCDIIPRMIPQTQPATPTLPITTTKGVLQNTVITLKSISETGQLGSTQQRPAGEKTKKNINYKTLVFYQLLLVTEPLNVADSMMKLFKDCSDSSFVNFVVLHSTACSHIYPCFQEPCKGSLRTSYCFVKARLEGLVAQRAIKVGFVVQKPQKY